MMEMLLPYVPYNRANKNFASANRRTMTKAEKKMRFSVLSERPWGYKFIRQKMIGSFILDFYCSRLLLGIEVDGPSHDATRAYDSIRTKKLWEHWIKIIRYQNEDVFYRLDRVAQDLSRELDTRAAEITTPFEFL